MAGALIVTVELACADLAKLEAERRRHYPPERNQVPAHLTLFHALPPSAEAEVRRQLGKAAGRAAPEALLAGIMTLDRGVAYRIVSDDLQRLRSELCEQFHGLLSAPDAVGWAPHVTIQNKVEPRVARQLAEQLRRDFHPRSLKVRGLAIQSYLDGPWQSVASYSFRLSFS